MIRDMEYIGNGKYWDISPNTEEELLRKEKSTLYGTNEYGYPTGLTLGENLQILDSQLNIVGELGAQIDDEHISTGTTYSSHKITELINQIVGFDVEIVDELPDEGDPHTIYLLYVSGETGDVYDEFLYIDGEWEQIGSTRIDLSQYYTKLETDALLDEKQDKLTPGDGIEIDTANTINVVGKQDILIPGENITIDSSNTISAVDTTYEASDFDIKDLSDTTGLREKWSNKQDKLIPGDGIEIDSSNTISVVGKQDTLIAGEGIAIDAANIISVTGGTQTLIPGDNISIDTANTISAEGYKYDAEEEDVYIVGVGGYDGTNEDEAKPIGRKIEEITYVTSSHVNELTDRVIDDEYVTSSHINEITVKLDNKQDVLTAGEGIEIIDNTISITGSALVPGDGIEIDSSNTISVVGKQDTLTAGEGIAIDTANTISVTGHTLVAGEGIEIDSANTISVVGKQDTLTAGEGIAIDTANTISVTGHTLVAGTNISISANTISAEGYKYDTNKEGVYIVGVGGYDGTNEQNAETLDETFDDITYVTALHVNSLINRVGVLESDKQDTLTAGDNITIDSSNTISADVNTAVVDMTSDTGDTYEIEPNIMYRFGERETLTITLIPGDANVLNEYMFEFTSGSVATTLNVPSTVTWLKDPDIQTGKIYQVSIENNLGVIGEWSNE